jgi:adenylyltransferase/sulfurtransferase
LEISPEDVMALIRSTGEFDLIDCREKDEFDLGRIEGGKLVPLSNFAELSQAFTKHPERPVVVYCQHGMRSQHAALFLRQKGVRRAYSMTGGIERWPGTPCGRPD